MQKRSQKLHSVEDKCRKNLGKWAEDKERLRNVTGESHAQIEDNSQKGKDQWQKRSSMRKIRGLQASDERRGSSASWAHGICFDAEQAMQQLSVFHGELNNIFQVQHQPAPGTLVHAPKGKVEEEGGKEMSRKRGEVRRVAKMDSHCHWAPTKGVRLVLFLILPCLRGIQGGSLACDDPLGTLQNSEWASLEPTFWIGVGPWAIFGGPIRKMGTPNGPLFFMVFAFGVEQT